jgi:hypothetical protein
MFWKKKSKKLSEGVDYRLIDIENSDLTAVQLVRGKFSGVTYYYNGAKIVEEGVMARLQFGYNIINPGKFSIEQLTTNEQFSTLMGDILTQLILKEEVYGQTRAFDTEEFDL